MSRLTNAQLIDWGKFYLRLAGTVAVNTTFWWLAFVMGALGSQAVGLVDIRTVRWADAGWTLLGTIVLRIALAVHQHPLPEPSEPTPPV